MFDCLVAGILTIKSYANSERDDLREPVKASAGEKDDPFTAARFRFEMIAGKQKVINPVSRLRALEHTRLFNMNKNVLKNNFDHFRMVRAWAREYRRKDPVEHCQSSRWLTKRDRCSFGRCLENDDRRNDVESNDECVNADC